MECYEEERCCACFNSIATDKSMNADSTTISSHLLTLAPKHTHTIQHIPSVSSRCPCCPPRRTKRTPQSTHQHRRYTPPHTPSHQASNNPKMIEGLQKIDPEYEERMLAFEIDCDNGKGDAWACHSVGEFLSVVKVSRRGIKVSFFFALDLHTLTHTCTHTCTNLQNTG